jgi:hypothetical protein
LKSSGIQEVRRDASVALEHINKKFGTENPSEFISPDWRGDFRAIKKRVLITHKTNNIIELKEIVKRMNTVLITNEGTNTRLDAAQILEIILELEPKLLEQFEQRYIDIILRAEEDKNTKKIMNQILLTLNPDDIYSLDFENTIKNLTIRENGIKIVPKYDFENDFIRYKINVNNNIDEILWDVRFKMSLFEKNFILRKIYPKTYDVTDDNIVFLNVIQPGDGKEIIFLIEPKSSQIYLEGKLQFKKYNDQNFTVINAPIITVDLFENSWPNIQKTTDKISIVFVRELFDFHMKYKSNNSFALPKSISPELAHSTSKEILSDLDFSLVMDVIERENFFGESIFYGITDKEEEIVVILRTSQENYSLAINIGCNINSYLVAIQVKFESLFRQLLMIREEITAEDKIIELKCPQCLQSFEKIERTFCPWCGEDIDRSKLLF